VLERAQHAEGRLKARPTPSTPPSASGAADVPQACDHFPDTAPATLVQRGGHSTPKAG